MANTTTGGVPAPAPPPKDTTETACQTGDWKPSKAKGDQVIIGDQVGQVIFSGIPCNVKASVKGKITWIEVMDTQVNKGDDVCTITSAPIA